MERLDNIIAKQFSELICGYCSVLEFNWSGCETPVGREKQAGAGIWGATSEKHSWHWKEVESRPGHCSYFPRRQRLGEVAEQDLTWMHLALTQERRLGCCYHPKALQLGCSPNSLITPPALASAWKWEWDVETHYPLYCAVWIHNCNCPFTAQHKSSTSSTKVVAKPWCEMLENRYITAYRSPGGSVLSKELLFPDLYFAPLWSV